MILGQTAIYLATSEKSNASYLAIRGAQAKVRATGDLAVPLHLRNAPTKLMKDLKYGSGYQYAHDFPGNFVKQEYLPDELSGTRFFEPGKNDREIVMRNWLRKNWSDHYGY